MMMTDVYLVPLKIKQSACFRRCFLYYFTMIKWNRKWWCNCCLDTFDNTLISNNFYVFNTCYIMFKWYTVFIINKTWKIMWITLSKTKISRSRNLLIEKTKKIDIYLPNGIALACWESKKWTFSENICNGIRTNGKSNVELTIKFGGQWIVQ